jgi:hypothetical protein
MGFASWIRIENYGRSERLSVFLRKERSDRGARRLSNKVEKIIDVAMSFVFWLGELRMIEPKFPFRQFFDFRSRRKRQPLLQSPPTLSKRCAIRVVRRATCRSHAFLCSL